ncbi:potassium transporter Kup [Blastopirellula marina]|uniref:Probable potassium transport system protein Kup n=1 Tax=Blastopirellula marina TaxID=124 RepID=A0A2S8G9H1_9BACT|nr:potassium transporter Kup [Blastopirellula marina]PQO41112.1 potassium transporter Kup [Blastopirellula marina]PTL45988.1 potassium transporter Kup [Blastopirellula marina]
MAEATKSPAPLEEVKQPAILSLIALGIVYGDIGTSPLYALRECFHEQHSLEVSAANILGLLSLVFWALILIISVKYLVFILRADNDGEGGILALASLVTSFKKPEGKGSGLIVAMGLLGAALLYADGMITPSISVLSAVEGIEVATPTLKPYVQAITIAILVGLFLFQSRGTAGVGLIFGPIMLVWFITLSGLGIAQIVQAPEVLWALNPLHAAQFLLGNGFGGFLALGTVFLVVTGGEALYADIGHFGTRPIRLGWYSLVLPALLLNYFGQGALLLDEPANVANPFYRLAPSWALYPLVVLATAATVIASQAVITGAFSLTLQAMQFGLCPRLTIRHTSHEQAGQVYLPAVNWVLMLACIGLVLGFRTSSNLAAAYGVAITITMVITSILFFFLVRQRWNWSLPLALIVSGLFLLVDLSFLGANLPKVTHGGWFPLIVAGGTYLLMSTWMAGRRLLEVRMNENSVPIELFLADLLNDAPIRVPGMAIFLTGNPLGTPPALRHNVTHNKVLHETVVLLTVATADVPHVRVAHRSEIEEIGEGVYRLCLTYGFMDTPNIPLALLTIRDERLDFARLDISYFVGREDLLATERPGIAIWREQLFAWMTRNSQRATDYFHLPPDQVVEVGGQIEL